LRVDTWLVRQEELESVAKPIRTARPSSAKGGDYDL
jgi:hypothetical protein